MPKAASSEYIDGAMEPRVRKLELDVQSVKDRVESLFDNGSPGILSQIRNVLMDKIDGYSQTVAEFIKGEPARKAHIENNVHQAVADAKAMALQAVADAKVLAKEALEENEKEQGRMHLDNRRTAERTEAEVAKLKDTLGRHEKFMQRGIGAVIVGQFVIAFIGFCFVALTFAGGLLWWVYLHVPIVK